MVSVGGTVRGLGRFHAAPDPGDLNEQTKETGGGIKTHRRRVIICEMEISEAEWTRAQEQMSDLSERLTRLEATGDAQARETLETLETQVGDLSETVAELPAETVETAAAVADSVATSTAAEVASEIAQETAETVAETVAEAAQIPAETVEVLKDEVEAEADQVAQEVKRRFRVI